ncbi:acyl-CoA thioesterase [Haloferax namakaokahaiae]|uniref:Acyl-CoA thioesterase n=1 Tax=Haloferax namakaokahaiae TaxID=1748331 RepID=A0ABD5ZDZ7_9EURY
MTTFERTWTVRFSDTDPFGIAHYPRIIDALHETADMFMEELGFPFWEISIDHGFGLPLVEIDMEFERPMEAGDDIEISVIPTLGTRSLRFDYVARKDGEVTFTGHETRVCASKDEVSSRDIPDDLREAIEPYIEE